MSGHGAPNLSVDATGLRVAVIAGSWHTEVMRGLIQGAHQTIVAALNTLREAAARAGRSEIVAFAEALVEHARTEEEVMYPAAVLVGQVVRQRLGQRARAAA